MKKITLSIGFVFAALGLACAQQQVAERPQLVVGISIDHLNDASLSMYWSNMSQGGFKRLAEQGTCFDECRYPYYSNSDLTDVVTLSTGSEPVQHGVQAEKALQQPGNKFVLTAFDKGVSAVNGSWKISGQ